MPSIFYRVLPNPHDRGPPVSILKPQEKMVLDWDSFEKVEFKQTDPLWISNTECL